jgi:hypothetical protein
MEGWRDSRSCDACSERICDTIESRCVGVRSVSMSVVCVSERVGRGREGTYVGGILLILDLVAWLRGVNCVSEERCTDLDLSFGGFGMRSLI